MTLPPLPVLLTLVALRAVAAQVFTPVSRAAVPALVPDRQLEPANSALSFGANGTEALGPVVAAALLPLVGIRGVLLVDVATFLVSAVLLAFLPRPPPTVTARPAVLADARAGLRYVLTAPPVRAVVLGFVAVVAFNGVDDVALVLLVRDTLAADGSAVALLYGAVGIGLLAGFALLTRRPGRTPLVALVIVGFAVSSLGNQRQVPPSCSGASSATSTAGSAWRPRRLIYLARCCSSSPTRAPRSSSRAVVGCSPRSPSPSPSRGPDVLVVETGEGRGDLAPSMFGAAE